MSISGVLIALEFNALTETPPTVPAGQWEWRLSHAVGETGGGLLYVPLGPYTESELMALAQAQAVIEANAATNNVEEFTINDVRGGAI
jgi:hypothetical protein